MDFAAERYVDHKYGFAHGPNIEDIITDHPGTDIEGVPPRKLTHQQIHSGDQDEALQNSVSAVAAQSSKNAVVESSNQDDDSEKLAPSAAAEERSFREQIAAFLILEFGVIFHSVIIGLNLGTAGTEL